MPGCVPPYWSASEADVATCPGRIPAGLNGAGSVLAPALEPPSEAAAAVSAAPTRCLRTHSELSLMPTTRLWQSGARATVSSGAAYLMLPTTL